MVRTRAAWGAATVGLVRDGDSWRLEEARGRFNEEPATDVRPALEQLLRRARPRNGEADR